MPTIALEGTGASIAFANSSFTSDLISLTLPEKAREVIETTHLGTTGAKTYKPAKLKNIGTMSAEFDHNPEAVDLTSKDPEQITISYPLQAGQTTPTKLVFNGFVTQQGGEEFKVDARMTTKVTIQVNGDVNVVAAT
jgi:hypothetical protein